MTAGIQDSTFKAMFKPFKIDHRQLEMNIKISYYRFINFVNINVYFITFDISIFHKKLDP